MGEIVFRRPPCAEKGGWSFYCVSGLCPFGYDPIRDCYPYMTAEQKLAFKELLTLRAEYVQYVQERFKL